jgi:hypothetical protein
MSEPERPPRADPQSQADRTLLGVAPPRLDSTADALPRSPVFVRSGTSVADDDQQPPPLPRMALPSRPPPRLTPEAAGVAQAPAALGERGRATDWAIAMLNLPARVGGTQVALWKVLAPGLLIAGALGALLLSWVGSAAKSGPSGAVPSAPIASASNLAAPVTKPSDERAGPAARTGLEGKAPETLSASELLSLADGRVEREREAAKALERKVQGNPALIKDKAVQTELLRLAGDGDTAREALATMIQLEAPYNADLLYEVWTGTLAKNDTTELARTLVYSTDVRPKASAALSVALELRLAETCEQYRAALPLALKAGDRRSLHLLTKLTNKRGCGPKKTEDCFACLRDPSDELTATINAVKSRRPPSYTAP